MFRSEPEDAAGFDVLQRHAITMQKNDGRTLTAPDIVEPRSVEVDERAGRRARRLQEIYPRQPAVDPSAMAA
jgi:hypothetical protein